MSTTLMMPTSFRRTLSILCLGLIVLSSGYSLDRIEFAKSLEQEGDWFRAIGQWKELRFDRVAGGSFWGASEHILMDYWRAKQYELGLAEVAALLQRFEELSGATLRMDALYQWQGLFQYRLSRFAEAEYSFVRGRSDLYLGLLRARAGNLTAAETLWNGTTLPDPETLAVDARSPLLAAGLSAVVPGVGQFYAGHWYDGVQAAAFVSFFGLATAGTYLYDSKFSPNFVLTSLVGSVTAVFYAANVYGAYKTAEFFNQNQANSRTVLLETAVFDRSLPNVDAVSDAPAQRATP